MKNKTLLLEYLKQFPNTANLTLAKKYTKNIPKNSRILSKLELILDITEELLVIKTENLQNLILIF